MTSLGTTKNSRPEAPSCFMQLNAHSCSAVNQAFPAKWTFQAGDQPLLTAVLIEVHVRRKGPGSCPQLYKNACEASDACLQG